MRNYERMERLKIAFNRMINDLNEEDTFQIVTFSSTAVVLYDKFQKNRPGKIADAIEKVSNLTADGKTNIYDSIMYSLELRNGV